MSKSLYLIRHGYALHNELFPKLGVRAFRIPATIDAPLTHEGHLQAIELGYSWKEKEEIELILVSPLTRALETCMNIFGDTNIPIESHEFLREYPIGEDTCNKRSSLNLLKKKYPKINFNLSDDEDTLWRENNRESINELENRLQIMIDYLKLKSEKKIAIIGHSSFIGQFKDYHIRYMENGDEELKHCYPYEFQFDMNYERIKL